MTLALILSPVVVPGLVPVRRPLPGVLENGVDHRFADQDAQVHYEKAVHRPARTEGKHSITTFREKIVECGNTGHLLESICYLNSMAEGQKPTPASVCQQQNCAAHYSGCVRFSRQYFFTNF